MFVLVGLICATVLHLASGAPSSATCNGKRTSFNELCCNGIIQRKTGLLRPACCMFTAYDAVRNICCYDTVHVKSGRKPMCCGHEMIDETVDKCCDNNTVSDTTCSIPSDPTCKDKRKSFTEMCCLGSLSSTVGLMKPGCCGFHAMDSQMNLCCHGEAQLKGDRVKPACCGRNIYDETKEVCCANNTVQIGTSCGY